jgi:type I restriction enzyme R subunit
MAYSGINREDSLVQATFASHLETQLGWDSVYAWNQETFGLGGTLGRTDTREVVLTRDLRSALFRLNRHLPPSAVDDAVGQLTQHDFSRSLLQHNRDFYRLIRDGVPVSWRDAGGQQHTERARVIDFQNRTVNGVPNNRFLAVRELVITGLRSPAYNRRADLVCFVNGLPLVFIELKAVYRNIRAGFDDNLRAYMDEHVVAHAFHHNAFLIVSNGHHARYGSITSLWEHFAEWKRLDEHDKGSLDAEVLLNGMLEHRRLLDLVENFILFDDSKPGGMRKIVGRNHQVLGVNSAVESVVRQEELKKEFPPGKRLAWRVVEVTVEAEEEEGRPGGRLRTEGSAPPLSEADTQTLELVESAHPDLGKLGVFWHTQGSGKSYSMAFFAEKVRRTISGKFTFLLMTDRTDLDDQLYKTFVGCGIAGKQTPRASSGEDLRALLRENHSFVFSLIHKFNQDVNPEEPYSTRDDLIVISDEAHRTQAGKLARNMRLALPNAAFIGFTGTPLFKNDHLTRRIFGGYVSRYDFKRSEEDGATVKLVYENRGEKLRLSRLDLNDRIADAIAQADLDPDKEALLEKLLGKDYEVITAGDRLDKIANDFVEYCATRWESGKSMLVCIDKITCGRMWRKIMPRWRTKLAAVKAAIAAKDVELAGLTDADERDAAVKELAWLRGQAGWMEETILEVIISEGQNEVADFQKWGIDIIPHRARMKQGFERGDTRVTVEDAFKDPHHPFRVAIVCAMWLTGFDVESLSTLYIDKPMKAHTLMQAIARANRVYPGKDFGLIVDYNGMLASLRAALAQYALGDDGAGGTEIVAPVEERVQALAQAVGETERHLAALGFDAARLGGAKGFTRIQALADAVEVVYTSDETKRRFEILARQVFLRFKALVMEPSIFAYAERHDNIEAIYKKLQERRDLSDVTDLMKELHLIVNEAIRAAAPGEDRAESRFYDLSRIDLAKLRDEFARKVKRKASALQNVRQMVEDALARMLAQNPLRMDYYRRYSEIVADYNREKDRVTIEETFARLVDFANSLSAEQRRAAEEGLSEEELALFDLVKRPDLSKADRERVKRESRNLLSRLREVIERVDRWTEKEQTQAEVKSLILDHVFATLPDPPFTDLDKLGAADRLFQHVWQLSASGGFGAGAAV